MVRMPIRYAIYYVPAPDSALWRFGSAVLGYDAYTGEDVPHWHPPTVAAEAWHAMTTDPRLYGFHATLKAPFRLRDNTGETELVESLERFAQDQAPVDLGEWIVNPVPSGRPDRAFLAMVPVTPPAALPRLEAAIVRHFDTLRAPLTEAEIARRRPQRLSDRQRSYLDAHGYPYVLEEFRFHMTLTSAIEKAGEIGPVLAGHARSTGVSPALHLDRLGLFKQEDGGRFRVVTVATLG
jgi:Protein of unknown function (DUF1045)